LQGGCRSGACAEKANRQLARLRLPPQPVDRTREPIRKQPDVEPELSGEPINLVLVAGEKVHQ